MKQPIRSDQPIQNHLESFRKGSNNNLLSNYDQLSSLFKSNFQLGETFYYVLPVSPANPKAVNIRSSEYIRNQKSEIENASIRERIHPADLEFYLQCEQKTNEFFSDLPPPDIPFFKARFDFRIAIGGCYKRYLQQRVVLEYAEESIRSFLIIMMDISSLKRSSLSHYSIVGINEKDCLDPNCALYMKVENHLPLSKREKEIYVYLMESLSSKDIASKLYVSEDTVRNHRKRILKKTGCQNTLDLIMTSYEDGRI